jgi:hypothetical protein
VNNSTKYTPSPWQVIGKTVRSKTFAIADLIYGEDAELKANGKLIAAAPELLEALRLATETVALHTGNGANFKGIDYPRCPNGEDVDYEAVLKQCRALIAKATGQSNE